MPREILTNIDNREAFAEIVKNNTGVFIVKFGAEWCKPCKQIEAYVKQSFEAMPDNVLCAILDIDERFDTYAFLKSKKMVNGIPALLCYYKGNSSYIPDDVVVGADANQLRMFFERCILKANSM